MEAAELARSLADRYWERLLELDPMIGTMTGDERYDDRLSDPGEAGRAAAESSHRAALEELERIDLAALGADLRGTLDILEAIAKRSLAEIDLRTDRLKVASHLWGPGQVLANIGSMQRADTPERLDCYEARL